MQWRQQESARQQKTESSSSLHREVSRVMRVVPLDTSDLLSLQQILREEAFPAFIQTNQNNPIFSASMVASRCTAQDAGFAPPRLTPRHS